MADATETKIDEAIAEAAAEKAYAAAAEAIEAEPANAPKLAKTKAVKPAPAEAPVAELAPAAVETPVEAVAKAPVEAPAPVVAAPVKVKPAKPAAKAKPAPKLTEKAVPAKPAPKKTVKTVKKAVKPAAKVAVKLPSLSKFKETIMAKTTTEDFTVKVKEAVADVQERAKAAYDKSTAAFGEINEFSKGNVEALVESGKILAAGLQDLGKGYVAEGKSAFETLTADVKELAAVKSPADFFKLQGEILRRNFDAAVAAGSKNSEAFVKLAGDAYAPLSSRVSLAVEKVKQAA